MSKYEAGGFMYYTTLPTDALAIFRDSIQETEAFGFEQARNCQWELGLIYFNFGLLFFSIIFSHLI